jgi:hypothetical protein
MKFFDALPEIPWDYRTDIILASLATKVLVTAFMIMVYGKFVDLFGITVYYGAAQSVTMLQWPWTHVAFTYPPLSFLLFLPAYLLTTGMGGNLGFILVCLMLFALCDVGVAFCVYWIGLKLYPEKMAFYAAILYATCVNAAYCLFSTYDAFPLLMMMLGITFCLYGSSVKGYCLSVLGLFTKIFPIGILPFVWVYHIKRPLETSLALLIGGLGVGIFLITVALGYNPYMLFLNGALGSNSYPVMLWQYFPSLPLTVIILMFRVFIVTVGCFALWYLYNNPSDANFLKCIFAAYFFMVFGIQFHSTNYITWFLPLAALLVVDRWGGIFFFLLASFLSFAEYPVGRMFIQTMFTPAGMVWYPILFAAYLGIAYYALTFRKRERIPEGWESV